MEYSLAVEVCRKASCKSAAAMSAAIGEAFASLEVRVREHLSGASAAATRHSLASLPLLLFHVAHPQADAQECEYWCVSLVSALPPSERSARSERGVVSKLDEHIAASLRRDHSNLVTLSASAADLLSLIDGTLSPMRAFAQRKVRVEGKVRALHSLRWIFAKRPTETTPPSVRVQVLEGKSTDGAGVYTLLVSEGGSSWTVNNPPPPP